MADGGRRRAGQYRLPHSAVKVDRLGRPGAHGPAIGQQGVVPHRGGGAQRADLSHGRGKLGRRPHRPGAHQLVVVQL